MVLSHADARFTEQGGQRRLPQQPKQISSQPSRLFIFANSDFHVYGSLKKLFLSFLLNYFQVVRKMFASSSFLLLERLRNKHTNYVMNIFVFNVWKMRTPDETAKCFFPSTLLAGFRVVARRSELKRGCCLEKMGFGVLGRGKWLIDNFQLIRIVLLLENSISSEIFSCDSPRKYTKSPQIRVSSRFLK